MVKRTLAAVDIGTNSSLFLLAQVYFNGKITPLRHEVRTNDLGRRLNERGELSAQVIELNLRLLRDFQKMAHEGGAQEIRIAATEALRRAANAMQLINRARNELDLELKVISGEEEAALTYRGVISGVVDPQKDLMVSDVGGGSTEIIAGENGNVTQSVSLPLGAVSLDRLYIRHDPAQADEIEAIRQYIRTTLGDLPSCQPQKMSPLIICGGTASALAGADLGLKSYQPKKISGHLMTLDRIDRFIAQFTASALDVRRQIPGMGWQRAQIILPGTLIIAELLVALERKAYVTSERGLRYGLLLA